MLQNHLSPIYEAVAERFREVGRKAAPVWQIEFVGKRKTAVFAQGSRILSDKFQRGAF